MAANIFVPTGVLTWLALALAVTLVASTPCCPHDEPLIATEEAVLCEKDLKDPSLIAFCVSYFTVDDFVETSSEVEIEGFRTDKYCTGTIVNSSWAKFQEVDDKLYKPIALMCFPDDYYE